MIAEGSAVARAGTRQGAHLPVGALQLWKEKMRHPPLKDRINSKFIRLSWNIYMVYFSSRMQVTCEQGLQSPVTWWHWFPASQSHLLAQSSPKWLESHFLWQRAPGASVVFKLLFYVFSAKRYIFLSTFSSFSPLKIYLRIVNPTGKIIGIVKNSASVLFSEPISELYSSILRAPY